uniref:THAP-type domain-containing protein n=1 Tax=Amphiprion percula TaxID=161767 RepID=A0A3P8TB09_AMPPE
KREREHYLALAAASLTETRKLGMTFHRFPKDYGLRRKWEAALRREGFAANDEWVLSSDHFDRAGQVCRLRSGVIPSVFNFPAHLGRVVCLNVRR